MGITKVATIDDNAAAVAVLRRAREILAAPASWTQYAGARDGRGDSVQFNDAGAVCWCLSGAVFKAARDLGVYGARYAATYALEAAIMGDRHVRPHGYGERAVVAEFNDASDTEQAHVLAAIDGALALLGASDAPGTGGADG